MPFCIIHGGQRWTFAHGAACFWCCRTSSGSAHQINAACLSLKVMSSPTERIHGCWVANHHNPTDPNPRIWLVVNIDPLPMRYPTKKKMYYMFGGDHAVIVIVRFYAFIHTSCRICICIHLRTCLHGSLLTFRKPVFCSTAEDEGWHAPGSATCLGKHPDEWWPWWQET